MINILSYVGMNMQSEVCLWCLLGLVRTIFDATLFKVNANLKQVWQMTMPAELSMPVQRVLRTMVSGIMLVQCFTVYVYLAAYIVLLYPVFLEERPTLVLPWLLLAAIRKLLCELTSLALGLGTCVLLGPARPPCIKFVVVKFTSIMPAFYMWMLVFSYYHALKVASAFKTFPAVLPPNDNDYGLELAVRRRRTKSLLGEEQLRKKLVANFYGERTSSITNETYLRPVIETSLRHSTDSSNEEAVPETDVTKPLTMSTTGWSDIGAYEDWFGSEVMIPRDTDRILEQIVLMLLRIGAYLKKEGIESIIDSQILSSAVPLIWHQRDNIDCATINADDTETPPLVGSSKGNTASYLREYPQIFMKKQGTDIPQTERTIASLKTVHSHVESEEGNTSKNKVKHPTSDTSIETIAIEIEKVPSKKKLTIADNEVKHEDTTDKFIIPRPFKSKQLAITEGKKNKNKRNKHIDLESQSKENVSETLNKMKNSLDKSETLHEDDKKISSISRILNENINNELPQSKILSNATTTNATDSKTKKQDKKLHNELEFIQNKQLTNIETQKSTDSKIIKQDSNKGYVRNEISTNIIARNRTESKTLQKDKNKESKDSKILKQDNGNECIQSKIPNNSQQLLYSKTLNEENHEESTDSKILKQDHNINYTQSQVSASAKTQNSTESTIITQDNNTESETLVNAKPQHTTSYKTLNEDKNEKSMDGKTLKQDNGNEFNQSKISTNAISQVSKESKILQEGKNNESINIKLLKQDINNELSQSKISTTSKIKNSRDSKTTKHDNNNEFIQSEISNNAQQFINSKTLNDDNYEESTDTAVLKQDHNNDHIQSEVSASAKTQTSTDSSTTITQDNKSESKTLTNATPQHTTSSKTLNEVKNEKYIDNEILKQDNNKDFTLSNHTTNAIPQVSKDTETFNKGNNKESMDSRLLKQDNSYELMHTKLTIETKMPNSTDSKISNEYENKEFTNSNISCEGKIKESKYSELSNEGNSKEFPLNKLHVNISNQSSTNSKISKVDNNKESTYSNLRIENKNKEFTNSKLLYYAENQEYADNKIPTKDITDSSDTCSCCNSNENNDTKTPDT